jgi:hypothetical protein
VNGEDLSNSRGTWSKPKGCTRPEISPLQLIHAASCPAGLRAFGGFFEIL